MAIQDTLLAELWRSRCTGSWHLEPSRFIQNSAELFSNELCNNRHQYKKWQKSLKNQKEGKNSDENSEHKGDRDMSEWYKTRPRNGNEIWVAICEAGNVRKNSSEHLFVVWCWPKLVLKGCRQIGISFAMCQKSSRGLSTLHRHTLWQFQKDDKWFLRQLSWSKS